MFNRKSITVLAVLAMAALVVAQGVVRLEARMTSAGPAEGKAKYKLSTRAGRQVQEELEFEGEDLAPNTTYDLTVAGVVVGQATTDGFGAFEWGRRSVGSSRYVVATGTPVTIQNANGIAAAGTFAPRP